MRGRDGSAGNHSVATAAYATLLALAAAWLAGWCRRDEAASVGDGDGTSDPAPASPATADALTPRELKRMRRVTDSMLSSHSTLRDRYRRRAQSLTLLIIALSITTASLSFASEDKPLSILYISARLSRWVAGLSLLIFFLAMVDLVIDWRRRTLEHDEAARRLGDLKARLRAPQIVGDRVDTGGVDPRVDYDRTTAMIPPISDRQFAPLKARAAYKVELSKAIDDHRGAPIWWLRLLVRWRGLRGKTAPTDAGTPGDGAELVDADLGAIDGRA